MDFGVPPTLDFDAPVKARAPFSLLLPDLQKVPKRPPQIIVWTPCGFMAAKVPSLFALPIAARNVVFVS